MRRTVLIGVLGLGLAALLLPAAASPTSSVRVACDDPSYSAFAVGVNGLTVTIDLRFAPGGSQPVVMEYVHDWGDGTENDVRRLTQGTSDTVTHTYARAGRYTIRRSITLIGNARWVNCDGPTVTGVRQVIVNRPPIARNDTFRVVPGDTLAGNVLQNDSDPDGDKITAVNWRLRPPGASGYRPGTGPFTVAPNGALSFEMPKQAAGGTTWRLTYQANDPWPRTTAAAGGTLAQSATSQTARVTISTGKCWGDAFKPKLRNLRIRATFTFDCDTAHFYEIELKIFEDDPARDDVVAQFKDIISIDEGGEYTDASGRQLPQFTRILAGICLYDGKPGSKSEFVSQLRYRPRGSGGGGADSEDTAWRTLSRSDTLRVKCP